MKPLIILGLLFGLTLSAQAESLDERKRRCVADGQDASTCEAITSKEQERICNEGKRTPVGGCQYVPPYRPTPFRKPYNDDFCGRVRSAAEHRRCEWEGCIESSGDTMEGVNSCIVRGFRPSARPYRLALKANNSKLEVTGKKFRSIPECQKDFRGAVRLLQENMMGNRPPDDYEIKRKGGLAVREVLVWHLRNGGENRLTGLCFMFPIGPSRESAIAPKQ